MTDWMNSGELIDWNRQANVNAGAYTGKYGNAPDPDIDGDAYFGGVSQYPYLRPVFHCCKRSLLRCYHLLRLLLMSMRILLIILELS